GVRPETLSRVGDGRREYCPVGRADAVPRPAKPARQNWAVCVRRAADPSSPATRSRSEKSAAPAWPAAARRAHDPPHPTRWLYQLLFLDRVPAYAAVYASVGLARAAAGAGAAGLVNAVLRRAAGAGVGGLPLPHPAADPLERLAIEWSHPRWLVERWAAELGRDELPRLLAANNVRGPSAVRANRLRTTPDALRAELAAARVAALPSAWAPDGLVVE